MWYLETINTSNMGVLKVEYNQQRQTTLIKIVIQNVFFFQREINYSYVYLRCIFVMQNETPSTSLKG